MNDIKELFTEKDPHRLCEKRIDYAIKNNNTVLFLLNSIEKLGCKLPNDFFICRTCPEEISGGITVPNSLEEAKKSYKPQVILCEDRFMDRSLFENTIVHELVHAYDLCRSNIDWTNCKQHACTEIRASSLSGECDLMQEFSRGYFKFVAGIKSCTYRRSVLSVKMNPVCRNVAESAVETVFDECFADTAPFDNMSMAVDIRKQAEFMLDKEKKSDKK